MSHINVTGAVLVVPSNGKATEKGASTINEDGVELLQDLNMDLD